MLFTPSLDDHEGLSLSEIIAYLTGFFPGSETEGFWASVFTQKRNVHFYPHLLALLRADTDISDKFVSDPHEVGLMLLREGYFCMNENQVPDAELYVFCFYFILFRCLCCF